MSGRSQAIRLPARLRLDASEVRIKQVGTALWVPRLSSWMESWLAGFDVRPWPLAATQHCVRIRSELERAGQPLSTIALMIASHAMAEDSVLITNNARKFLRVPGLAVEEWAL